jgi:hypothetical protein
MARYALKPNALHAMIVSVGGHSGNVIGEDLLNFSADPWSSASICRKLAAGNLEGRLPFTDYSPRNYLRSTVDLYLSVSDGPCNVGGVCLPSPGALGES